MEQYGLLIDYEYCTGCQSCEVACKVEHGFPVGKWGIRVFDDGPWQMDDVGEEFNWNKIAVPTDLCDLCADRLAKGKDPLCVHQCLADCMRFGTIEEMAAELASRPEDVVAFYGQLVDWLADVKSNITNELKEKTAKNPMVFKLRYDYFNSSSAKYILDMVILIDNLFKNGLNVRIEWLYKKEDEDMLETGQEFTDLIKCPIDFIAI